jgi:hypothetical protein
MALFTFGSYAIVFLSSVLFLLIIAIRRRYFSSIGDIPGPFWASFSILWEVWTVIEGHIEEKVIALHEKYGKMQHFYFLRNFQHLSDPLNV